MGQNGVDPEVTPKLARGKDVKGGNKKNKKKGRKFFSWFSCLKGNEEEPCNETSNDIPASKDAAPKPFTGDGVTDRKKPLDICGKGTEIPAPTNDVFTQIVDPILLIGSLQKEIAAQGKKRDKLQEEVQKLKTETESLHMENQILNSQKMMMEIDHRISMADVMEKHSKELTQSKDTSQHLECELEKMRRLFESLEKEMCNVHKRYEMALTEERSTGSHLKAEMDILRKEVSRQQKANEIQEQEMQRLQEDLQKRNNVIDCLEKDKLDLAQKIEERDKTIEEKQNFIDEMNRKNLTCNETFIDMLEKLTQENECLRTECQVLKSEKEKQEMEHWESMANLMEKHSKELQDLADSTNDGKVVLEPEIYQEMDLMLEELQEEYERQVKHAGEIKEQAGEELTQHCEAELQEILAVRTQISSLQKEVAAPDELMQNLLKQEAAVRSQEKDILEVQDKAMEDEEWNRIPSDCRSVQAQGSPDNNGAGLASVQVTEPSIRDRELYEEQLKALLESRDFRMRLRGIGQLVTDSKQRPDMVLACKFQVFDALAERLVERNNRVNLATLEAIQEMIPQLKDGVGEVVKVLLCRIVDNHLNTKRKAIYNAAINAVNAFITNIDNALLVDVLCSRAQHLPGKAKAVIIEKLAAMVEELYPRTPQTVERKILPLLWPLLNSTCHKKATESLLRALHTQMGSRLRDFAASQSSRINKRLNVLLRVFSCH